MSRTDSSSPAARLEVPLLDLKAQYASLRDEILPAVEAVLESQQLINGPAVKQFEAAVARYSGVTHGVGMSSGTDALLSPLMALGIGAGDEVITTPFTFFATAGSIWRVGAKPVFVDIDPRTFNIDSHRVEGAVSAKTKAIMPVHLFGQAADMDPILDLSSRRGLHVIEDAAQAIGAEYKGRRVGSFGTAGCFSFFPSKNLGGAGDGGMVVTRNAVFAEKLLFFRNHGSEIKYYHKWVGGNFRLDTIQAAYLLIKLEHLDEWSEGRRRNAALYAALLSDVPELVLPWVSPDCRSIYNQYVIRTPRRDALRKHLSERGIGTEVYYPLNLHEQECFRDLGYAKGDFPEAEKAALEVLALPIYPELREEQIRHVAASIREFHGR